MAISIRKKSNILHFSGKVPTASELDGGNCFGKRWVCLPLKPQAPYARKQKALGSKVMGVCDGLCKSVKNKMANFSIS